MYKSPDLMNNNFIYTPVDKRHCLVQRWVRTSEKMSSGPRATTLGDDCHTLCLHSPILPPPSNNYQQCHYSLILQVNDQDLYLSNVCHPIIINAMGREVQLPKQSQPQKKSTKKKLHNQKEKKFHQAGFRCFSLDWII